MAAQNLTTYSIGGAESAKITSVTSDRATVSNLLRSDSARLVKDFGVNYFFGDFTITFTLNSAAAGSGGRYSVALGNTIWDGFLEALSEPCVIIEPRRSVSARLTLYARGLSTNTDVNISLPSQYTIYCKLKRAAYGGVYGKGRYTLDIRTGSHTGPLEDVLIADMDEEVDFRYFYPILSADEPFAANISGYTEFFDIKVPTISSVAGKNIDEISQINGVPTSDIKKIMGIHL